jgi:AbrB family looped-hinge helix DNA binding protein
MHMGRITAKGQITIPAELRKRLGIRAGTRINWIEEKGRLVLIPMTARGIKEIMGFLKPKPGEPSAFDELFKERARERQREDIKAAQYEAEFKGKKAKAERIIRRYRNTLRALA